MAMWTSARDGDATGDRQHEATAAETAALHRNGDTDLIAEPTAAQLNGEADAPEYHRNGGPGHETHTRPLPEPTGAARRRRIWLRVAAMGCLTLALLALLVGGAI